MSLSSTIEMYHVFFFSGSSHHLDLHSFPTRRSSDLSDAVAGPAALSIASGKRPLTSTTTASAIPATVSRRRLRDARSEEHTSELQSLRHLVCRLLLEKKKQKNKKKEKKRNLQKHKKD